MNDRTTKILLLLIGLGLWANVLAPWLRPEPVVAHSTTTLQSPPASLDNLGRIEWYLRQLHWGNCRNDKIC